MKRLAAVIVVVAVAAPASALAAKTGTLTSGNIKITGPVHFQSALNSKLQPFCGFSNDHRGLEIRMNFGTGALGSIRPTGAFSFRVGQGAGLGAATPSPVLHDGTYNLARIKQADASFQPFGKKAGTIYAMAYGHGPSSLTLKNNLLSGHFSAPLYPEHSTHQGPAGDPTKTPLHAVVNWKCKLS